MTYFTGKGYGVSTLTDISGRPLLTYQGPNDKAPILLSDRVAVVKDPTIVQTWTLAELYNTRMPTATSTAIKKAVGGTSAQELDHKISLELGGSNQIANLMLQTNNPGSTNNPTDAYETQLSQRVQQGNISLQEAWFDLATEKGYQLGEQSDKGVTITFADVTAAIYEALTNGGGGAGGKVLKNVQADTAAQLASNLAQLKANPLDLNAREAYFTAQLAATEQVTGLDAEAAGAVIATTTKAVLAAAGQNPADASTALGNMQNQSVIAGLSENILQGSTIRYALQIAVQGLSVLPIAAIVIVVGIVIAGALFGPEILAIFASVPFLGSITTAFGISTAAGVLAGATVLLEILFGWAALFAYNVHEFYDTQVLGPTQLAQAFSTTAKGVTSSASTPAPVVQYTSNAQATAAQAGTSIPSQTVAPTTGFQAYVASLNIPTPLLTPAELTKLQQQYAALSAPAASTTSTPATSQPAAGSSSSVSGSSVSGTGVHVSVVAGGVLGSPATFTPSTSDIFESMG
ncbi:MAG: hypothetical protein ACREGR_03075, partial [Minisyncoccia bacterium]